MPGSGQAEAPFVQLRADQAEANDVCARAGDGLQDLQSRALFDGLQCGEHLGHAQAEVAQLPTLRNEDLRVATGPDRGAIVDRAGPLPAPATQVRGHARGPEGLDPFAGDLRGRHGAVPAFTWAIISCNAPGENTWVRGIGTVTPVVLSVGGSPRSDRQ